MAGKGAIVIGSQSTAASVTDTNVEVTAASTRLLLVNRHRVSQATHKTSEQYTVFGQRVTTSGTGTAYTPLLKEPGSGAVGFVAEVASSVEPTYTANTILLQAAVNSLTGRDIVYPPGQELYIAPSALLGFYVTTPSGTTTASYVQEGEFTELG